MMIKCSFNALFENYLKITLVDNFFLKSTCVNIAVASPMSRLNPTSCYEVSHSSRQANANVK